MPVRGDNIPAAASAPIAAHATRHVLNLCYGLGLDVERHLTHAWDLAHEIADGTHLVDLAELLTETWTHASGAQLPLAQSHRP
mgnify:CR=1 FL=1